jgi:HK97 family phage portal protein
VARMTPVERLGAAWSLLRGGQVREASLEALLTAERARYGGSTAGVLVTPDTALRHSAVWAAKRLRANLISSLPVDVYRRRQGVQVKAPMPPSLVEPTPGVAIDEWLYGSQWDLDDYGNVFGIIRERTPMDLPAVVELCASATVSIISNGTTIRQVRVNGELVPLRDLWHERQYTPAGFALGLSPVQAAAASIGGYLAAQDYQNDWFAQDGAHPMGVLKNAERTLTPEAASEMKRRFKAAVRNRDIFVTGKDWEWTAEAVAAENAGFLEAMRWGSQDVARFFDVPADVIDAAVSGQSITYANTSQRNTQLLVMHIGPAVRRRERALSAFTPATQYVKLNTDALLQMDPETRSRVLVGEVAGRVRAPSEVRELHNLQPFTEDQYAEFDRLFGARTVGPVQQNNARWEAPS